MICLPLIHLATALTVTDRTYSATSVGSGAAITYILLLPAILFRTSATTGSAADSRAIAGDTGWGVWRRAVLPFSLVTAAMWIITGSTGHFRPLHGQFLITLFLLGTWLFKLECKPHDRAKNPAPDLPDTDSESDNPAVLPTSVLARILAATILAAALTIAGVALLSGKTSTDRLIYLMPAAGVLACFGPILFAVRAGPAKREDWGTTLGYAAMTAACLVPGLAGFLQPAAGAPPLYGPDGAYLALAAGLVLAFGEEGLAQNRASRRVLLATWAVWLAWVLLSALLARDHVSTTTQPADWSVWDPV